VQEGDKLYSVFFGGKGQKVFDIFSVAFRPVVSLFTCFTLKRIQVCPSVTL
jgi:hypothetical protein